VGLPVAARYCVPTGNKRVLRKKLGWPLDKPIVLLVGGGDGMGPLGTTARAIDESGLDIGLVIVCGRNEKLKAHLESESWENPAFIYGFTRDLAEFMRAADSEDYLPAIVNAGNVRFIEKDYAGAKALYNRAYAKAPDNPALLLQLSRTLFELGDYAASEAMYKRLEMVNEGLAAQYGYLGKGGSGKAAERSDSPAWME